MKTGKRLQGYPILGTFDAMEGLLAEHGFGGVFLSFMTAAENDGAVARIKAFCRKHGLSLKRFYIALEEVDLDG